MKLYIVRDTSDYWFTTTDQVLFIAAPSLNAAKDILWGLLKPEKSWFDATTLIDEMITDAVTFNLDSSSNYSAGLQGGLIDEAYFY